MSDVVYVPAGQKKKKTVAFTPKSWVLLVLHIVFTLLDAVHGVPRTGTDNHCCK